MSPGKMLIGAGLLLIAAGVLALLWGKIPFLGKLPLDIRIDRENFSFYFPLGTCLLLSLLVSVLLHIFRR